MPEIKDIQRARATNESGYLIDTAKLADMPDGVHEMDGLREKDSQSDQETTRVYFVPWSIRHAFRLWVLGDSDSKLEPSLGSEILAEAKSFYELVTPGAADPPETTILSRVIPAQDPERPWLFASSCELLKGEGAVILDPNNVVLDQDGNEVFGEGPGKPLIAPCVAYVDNNSGDAGTAIPGLGGNQIPIDATYGDGAGIYKVIYRPRNYTILSDSSVALLGHGELGRWCEITEEYNLEGLPLVRLAASGQLKFLGPATGGADSLTDKLIPESGTMQIATAMINVDWYDVPDRPMSAFAKCVGKVNSQPFGGVRGTPRYVAGQLFCLPWRTKQTVGPTGRITWQIRYRFALRPQGWNAFPYATSSTDVVPGAGFRAAAYGGTATPTNTVYKSADFNLLFQPPPPVNYLAALPPP